MLNLERFYVSSSVVVKITINEYNTKLFKIS